MMVIWSAKDLKVTAVVLQKEKLHLLQHFNVTEKAIPSSFALAG